MFPDEEPKKTQDMSEKKNPSDGFGGGVSGKMAEGGVGWGGRGGDGKRERGGIISELGGGGDGLGRREKRETVGGGGER